MSTTDKTTEERRVSWSTRINVRESTRSALRVISDRDRIPVPTLIGIAMEAYITSRTS